MGLCDGGVCRDVVVMPDLTPSPTAGQGDNLVLNPGFEDGLDAEKNNNVASAGHCKARAEAKERLEAVVKCKK